MVRHPNRLRGTALVAIALPGEGVMMDKTQLVNVLGGGAVTFGVVAVAAPEAMHSGYGMASTSTSRSLMRLWGTRTATLGVLAMRARDEDRDGWLLALAVMNGVDAVLSVAGMRDGIPLRAGVGTAATSAVFAALLLVARGLD